MLVFQPGLTIEERDRGGKCVLRLSGELDMASSDQLEALLRERARDYREIVVELDAITFVDSTGIRSILAGYDASSVRGHRLVAIGASPRVRRVLEVCGLIDAGPFASDPERPTSWPLSTVQGASRARTPRRTPPPRASQKR
jgi:anti-anti-sigma factor